MPLKAVLDRLEDAPEAVREYYREKDGKWILDAEVPPGPTDAAMRALEHERRQRQEAVRAREEHAQKLAALEAKLAELEKAQPSAGQDDVKAQLARYKDEYNQRAANLEKLIHEEKAKREAAERQVRETKLTDILRDAAKKAGVADGEPLVDFLNRAKPLYRENPETGEFEPYENGQIAYGFDEPSRPRTPTEVAREILKTATHLRAPSSGGGAAGASATSTNGTIRVTRAEMKDPNKYAQVKAQAEKTGAQVEVTN